jgi:hypothetical protein
MPFSASSFFTPSAPTLSSLSSTTSASAFLLRRDARRGNQRAQQFAVVARGS